MLEKWKVVGLGKHFKSKTKQGLNCQKKEKEQERKKENNKNFHLWNGLRFLFLMKKYFVILKNIEIPTHKYFG